MIWPIVLVHLHSPGIHGKEFVLRTNFSMHLQKRADTVGTNNPIICFEKSDVSIHLHRCMTYQIILRKFCMTPMTMISIYVLVCFLGCRFVSKQWIYQRKSMIERWFDEITTYLIMKFLYSILISLQQLTFLNVFSFVGHNRSNTWIFT